MLESNAYSSQSVFRQPQSVSGSHRAAGNLLSGSHEYSGRHVPGESWHKQQTICFQAASLLHAAVLAFIWPSGIEVVDSLFGSHGTDWTDRSFFFVGARVCRGTKHIWFLIASIAPTHSQDTRRIGSMAGGADSDRLGNKARSSHEPILARGPGHRTKELL